MKRTVIVGITLAVATACSGGSATSHRSDARSPSPPPSTATATANPTATSPATDGDSRPTPGAPGSAHPATALRETIAITVAPSAYGDILETGRGFTFYSESDRTDAGRPARACTDACAETWPPLIATTGARLGPGVDQHLVGTVTRPDGTAQLTYAGRPLHTYARDHQPGHIDGQAIDSFGGTWVVVPATVGAGTAPLGTAPAATPAGV